jgi:hypothetical protein
VILSGSTSRVITQRVLEMLLESSCKQLNYCLKIVLKLTSTPAIGMKLGLAVPHMTVPTLLLAFGSASLSGS